MLLSNLMGLLQQYAKPGASNTGNAEQDFDEVSQPAALQALGRRLV